MKSYKKLNVLSFFFVFNFILIFAFYFKQDTDGTLLSFHGLEHGYYVFQFLNNSYSISDVVSSEISGSTYFIYHLLIALISKILKIHYLYIFCITNVMFFISTLFFLKKISKLYTNDNFLIFFFCCLPFLIYSIDSDINVVSKFLLSNLDATFPVTLKYKFIDFYDVRALNPMAKFNFISGSSLGICLFVYSFYNFLRNKMDFVKQSIISFIAILCHPISGFVIICIYFFSIVTIYIRSIQLNLKLKYLVINIIFLFLFYFYSSFLSRNFSSSFLINFPNLIEIKKILISNFFVLIIIFLFFVKNFNKSINHFFQNEPLVKSVFFYLILLFFTFFFDLIDKNQYKFLIYNSFLGSLIIFFIVKDIIPISRLNKFFKYFFIIFLSIVIISKYLIYYKSSYFKNVPYTVGMNSINFKNYNLKILSNFIKKNTQQDYIFYTDIKSFPNVGFANVVQRRNYINSKFKLNLYNNDVRFLIKKREENIKIILNKVKTCQPLTKKENIFLNQKKIFFIFQNNIFCKNNPSYFYFDLYGVYLMQTS